MEKSLDLQGRSSKLGCRGRLFQENIYNIPNTISSIFLVKQLISAWPLIQKGLWIFPKIIRKKLKRQNFRGSLRDPLLYLASFSLFLFVFTFLWAPTSLGSLSRNTSFLFVPHEPNSLKNDNVFLAQGNTGEVNSPIFNILQRNSLVGTCAPIAVSPSTLGNMGYVQEEEIQETRDKVIEYYAQMGDTVASLAEEFGISVNTIAWANDLSSNSKLKEGQKLIILPVSGILHYVKSGETLSQIALKYEAEAGEIAAFNELSEEEIFSGDILVIPDGVLPAPPKKIVNNTASSSSFSAPQVPLADSYFIFPTQGKKSQGLHWYNAVDIAASCGTPIYAAAQGTIIKTKFGDTGLGNYIVVSHPNGASTYYGHLQSILVSPGEQVSQGQIIALLGGKPGMPGSGNSTGCHVHFEVHGARNPF